MINITVGRPGNSFHIVFWVTFLFFLLFAATGCEQSENIPKVNLKQKTTQTKELASDLTGDSVKIAVAAMISPKETFNSYKELLAFISDQLDHPVKLIQRKTYQEVNDLLEKSKIDAAFVCTGAYVSGHDKFDMELLVAPVVNGATVYHSYILVNQSSTITTLEELRGKSFAFTDPMSNTGKAAPTDMLARIGEKPETYFSETTFTYSHDNSIKAVAHNVVDGAAVDSLVWEYLNGTNPEYTSRTRVIAKSEPYGIPPVVIAKGLAPSVKKKLLEIFLNIHKDPVGKALLDSIMIEKFVQVDDSIYDSVREMAKKRSEK